MKTQRHNDDAREPSHAGTDERIASLFQPDTVLSSQYFENLRRKTLFEPERRLMLAILEDGIDCYLKNLFARGEQKNGISTKPRLGSPNPTAIGFFPSPASATRWS